jgi:hypothetical protein
VSGVSAPNEVVKTCHRKFQERHSKFYGINGVQISTRKSAFVVDGSLLFAPTGFVGLRGIYQNSHPEFRHIISLWFCHTRSFRACPCSHWQGRVSILLPSSPPVVGGDLSEREPKMDSRQKQAGMTMMRKIGFGSNR